MNNSNQYFLLAGSRIDEIDIGYEPSLSNGIYMSLVGKYFNSYGGGVRMRVLDTSSSSWDTSWSNSIGSIKILSYSGKWTDLASC